jgi:hypothetical protein
MNRPYNYYFLRALHCRGELRSPDMGVQQDAPTNETIVLVTFYENIIIACKTKTPSLTLPVLLVRNKMVPHQNAKGKIQEGKYGHKEVH